MKNPQNLNEYKKEFSRMRAKNYRLNQHYVKELRNKTLLITGGAGSIGSALVKKTLWYPVKAVRVLDMDENGLFRLKRAINDSRLRLLLGNVLDKERVDIAGNDVDIIIHTAAVKNIEISEFNPIETIDININGTVNMIKMCMKNKPRKFLNISTDKAADASTLYGTTKQLGERLTSWAGLHITTTKFASVRLGNIIESRGNVFDIWDEELKNKQPLSITHRNMKRYFVHIDGAVDFILKSLILMNMGEIFIPKMKSYKIEELARKISKNHKIIGRRRGEKLEEVLITNEEKKRATDKENMWIIRAVQ